MIRSALSLGRAGSWSRLAKSFSFNLATVPWATSLRNRRKSFVTWLKPETRLKPALDRGGCLHSLQASPTAPYTVGAQGLIRASKGEAFGLCGQKVPLQLLLKSFCITLCVLTGSTGQLGLFICQPGCLHVRLGSDLGQKKIRAKEIHLESFSADADYTKGLFIIYRSCNSVLYVTVFGHINKQRIREDNKKALILFFSPQIKGR